VSDDFEVGGEIEIFVLPYIFHLCQVTTWHFQSDYVTHVIVDVQHKHL